MMYDFFLTLGIVAVFGAAAVALTLLVIVAIRRWPVRCSQCGTWHQRFKTGRRWAIPKKNERKYIKTGDRSLLTYVGRVCNKCMVGD